MDGPEAFIYREAAFLDDRAYSAWLDLFAAEGRYWVPLRRGATSPENELNLIYEGKLKLERRIGRLTGGKNHAEQPPSEVIRSITNILVVEDTGSRVLCRSKYIAVIQRLGTTRMVAGDLSHTLIRDAGKFSILQRRLDLLGANEPKEDLSFIP
ncbi:MAG TPA: aromatic-ring-hydroxylating dioxygenase subunit beta [Burkholderiaceae bacterium]|nr:aromatic-ring-hydroxylating dioxygenase subunit beta [Burkholderiaceae bacterium]